MGFFGDSKQETELKELMQQGYALIKRMSDECERNNSLDSTPITESCISQLEAIIKLLYEKSADLSMAKNFSIQTLLDGRPSSLADAKTGFSSVVVNYKQMQRRAK